MRLFLTLHQVLAAAQHLGGQGAKEGVACQQVQGGWGV